jgi:hypothetical protein
VQVQVKFYRWLDYYKVSIRAPYCETSFISAGTNIDQLSQMTTHSDGILVSASGFSTPVQTSGHAVERVVKYLPADFYAEFLSDTARERKPSPSEFPILRVININVLIVLLQSVGCFHWKTSQV